MVNYIPAIWGSNILTKVTIEISKEIINQNQ